MYIIGFYILLCIIIFFSIYTIIRRKQQFDYSLKKERDKIEKEIAVFEKARDDRLKLLTENFEVQAASLNEQLHALEGQKRMLERDLVELKREGELRIAAEVEADYQRMLGRVQLEIQERSRQQYAESQKEFENWCTLNESQKVAKAQELEELTAVIENFRQQQAAINEEIRRRREIAEQTDFYRIVLSEDAKHDIRVLQSIRQNLKNSEKLDKLIYDVYVAKPVLEMTKRVLKGKDLSGIYKITRLSTGEAYVGKSSAVLSRWKGHAKTAMGAEAVAHSMLHIAMEQDGIDQFTFELLEEVPKEKLSEREKFWIDFYQTKNFGLNERLG